MALLITFLAGMSMAVGAAVVKFARKPELISNVSIAVALGSMAALVALDLGPEAIEATEYFGAVPAIVAVAAGAALLLALDHFIPDHDDEHAHELHRSEEELAIHIGIMAVLALVIHNVVEGMTIYALSSDDVSQGAIYALGVGLHNIPMGMLVYSTLRHEPRTIKAVAFGWALLSTLLGGIVMLSLSSVVTEPVMGMLTCIALGMILYIAIAELLPHALKSRPAWVSVASAACGVALVYVATMLG
jgi:ZIP family zinc transporter